MTIDEAKRAAIEFVGPLADDDPVILDEFTIEKSYGWVFFYNSKRFIETGNLSFQLAGNGPIVVFHSGDAFALPAALETDEALAMLEKDRGLSP